MRHKLDFSWAQFLAVKPHSYATAPIPPDGIKSIQYPIVLSRLCIGHAHSIHSSLMNGEGDVWLVIVTLL